MTSTALPKRGWFQAVGLAVVLFLLVVLLSAAIPSVRDWQLRFNDSFFRFSPTPRPRSRIVLVTIDDQSLQRYGRWPWSRTVLAKLIDNLNRAGASVVGLDILLSEPQDPEADKALQEALNASRAVIVDKLATFEGGPRWVEPIPIFAQVAAVGHAHAPLDIDSVCRTYPARELTVDGSRWAFGVEVARREDPIRTAAFLETYGIPAMDSGSSIMEIKPVLVPIAYRRDGFDTVSAQTALESSDLPAIKHRPVLVGFGTTEIGDRLNTPLNPEFPTPGVEVNAQIVDAILTGRNLREIPLWAKALVLFATCLAAVFVFRKWRGTAVVVALAVIGATATYGVALAAFNWGSRILPAGAMMLSILVAPLLVYTADFIRVERSVTQQLLGLRSWLSLRGKVSAARDKADLSWRLELLQQLQTELGSLYELHKTILESTQDLVAIFDKDGQLLLRNHAFADAYRLDAGSTLALAQVRSKWNVTNEAPLVVSGSIEEGEVSLDGELYSARIAPLPPTRVSPSGGTIVTLTSLRTRVERDRARAEALGFITHELRTPLSSIQGFAELMLQYPNSPVCAGAPETIFRESKRLLALISSYLDVLRLDAGSKPISLSFIELESIVLQIFDILKPLADAAGMQLVLKNEDPGCIMGDAPLISGAVLNLVSNAIKYGQPGSPINVRCFRDNEEVIISVQNLGKPIAEQDVARLFDPYYRASNVEKTKTGWGLGLAFVKRIAEKHGGTVRAESLLNGAQFEIHLPANTEPVMVAKEKS